MIIKTAEGNLVDEVYSSPVDEWQHRARGLVILIAVIVIALIVLYLAWYFGRDRTRQYSDIQDHFKYGSIGSEPGGSIFDPVRRRASAVLDLQNAAAGLPGQTAGRLRVARAGL